MSDGIRQDDEGRAGGVRDRNCQGGALATGRLCESRVVGIDDTTNCRCKHEVTEVFDAHLVKHRPREKGVDACYERETIGKG
jgi:hypothetical protein